MNVAKAKQKSPRLKLRVISPQGVESENVFTAFPVTFGRTFDNTIPLDDSDISRRHAEIYLSGDRLFLRDCRSLNGVRVNGEMIIDLELTEGATIQIGQFRIIAEAITNLHEPDEREGERDSKELTLTPDGTGGMVEVIRAIDLEKVLSNQGIFEDPAPLLVTGSEEAREHHRKLSQAYSNLMVIMDFISSLGSFSHVRQICEQFNSVIHRVFPRVEATVIMRVDPDDSEPQVMFVDGVSEHWPENHHPSRTILSRVVQEMRAVYAVDARKDPRFVVSDSVARRGVRSMMCVPLVARGEVIGAVYVDNVSHPYCFSNFDLNLLTVFAFHLAMAVELSQVLEERDRAFERAANSLQAAKKDRIALLLQYSQSEKKFRALFEQSALGAAVINLASLRVEEVNDGMVRMLGYNRRQLTCMNYNELLDPEETFDADHWLGDVRREGQGSAKTALKTANGEKLVTLQSCRALRLGDSETMVAYFIDITDKERAEEETRRQLLRVTALSELSQELMTSLASQDIFQLLFEKVQEVALIDDFQVAMREEEESLSVVFAISRMRDGSFRARKERDKITGFNPSIRRVLSEERPLLKSNEETLSAARGFRDPFGYPKAFLYPSALYLPLASRNKVQGIICLQAGRFDVYDVSQIEMLQAMAGQAALALSNARAFESIREKEESLRQLSAQIMTAQETERGRISRELHDGIGQQLTAMKYMLETMRKTAEHGSKEKLEGSIAEARELATQIIQDLRNISQDLRPTMLDDLGLKPTLDWFFRQYQNRCGIAVDWDYDPALGDMRHEMSTAIYRIIQEALGNAAKHSDADHIAVLLKRNGGQLEITLKDNGKGFDPAILQEKQHSEGCSGMLNMQERASFLGGTFRLETEPGNGATLYFEIPIKENP